MLAEKLTRVEVKKLGLYLNEFINTPCTSFIATSFVHGMSSEQEVGETSPFTEPVGRADQGGLEIGEEASTVTLVPDLRVVPDLVLAAYIPFTVFLGIHLQCFTGVVF